MVAATWGCLDWAWHAWDLKSMMSEHVVSFKYSRQDVLEQGASHDRKQPEQFGAGKLLR